MTTRKAAKTDNNNNSMPDFSRDFELENIVGNLMIAEYQVNKLRNRTIERMFFAKTSNKNGSATMFKHNDKWYKVTMQVAEMPLEQPTDTEEQGKI